ncbi:MAG: RHS repeat domain-containing protein [Syntrophobacteraceae bacterium]
MKPARIAATLMLVAASVFCGFLMSAQAMRYEYDDKNRLAEVHFEDANNTWIQYTYDANGNRTEKVYHNPAPAGGPGNAHCVAWVR